MDLYDHVVDLPVTIGGSRLINQERETSRGYSRRTTIVALDGGGHVGYGEDVTYDADEHEALVDLGGFDLTGTRTVGTASDRLDAIDLFPKGAPDRDVFRNYRRWAYESAVLDLALKQAGQTLADAMNRAYQPVRFVVSTGLGDPPDTERVHGWRTIDPGLEFKLDVSPHWSPDLIAELADIRGIRILDFKAQSKWPDEVPDTPRLYRQIIDAFPETLFEDPAMTPEIRELLAPISGRITWDSPITSLESITSLPWRPDWLNIKPSRFGSIESLINCIEHCLTEDIRMYGGGQFELSIGREHLHALASLFYPESPNDVAPTSYNAPEPQAGLPPSPLSPPRHSVGLRWADDDDPPP